MGRPSRAEAAESQRKQRIKYGDPKLRMSVEPSLKEKLEKQGKVARWVNDEKGRVEKLQLMGYEFVPSEGEQIGDPDTFGGNTDMGSRISKIVGSTKDGKPLRSYLMVQDKESYEEDQSLKEAENKKVDEAIRRGANPQTGEHEADRSGSKTYAKNIQYTP